MLIERSTMVMMKLMGMKKMIICMQDERVKALFNKLNISSFHNSEMHGPTCTCYQCL